jgi:hypothetical protein
MEDPLGVMICGMVPGVAMGGLCADGIGVEDATVFDGTKP